MTTRRPGAKVLFLSGLQVFPTLSGGTLRSFALANALGRHGLDVSVHSLVGRKQDYLARRPSEVQAWPEGIREYVDRGTPGFLAQYGSYGLGLPPLWLTGWLRAAAASPAGALLPARLRERLSWCDVVLADFPFVHPVFGAPGARGKLHVLSTHNVEHHLFEGRAGWRARACRAAVRAVEVRAARACHVLVACCTGDLEFFQAQAPGRRTVLVPNGVDLRRFQGIRAHRAEARRELGLPDGVKVFLFTASKWGPNREAFDYLLRFAGAHARLLAEQRIHILAVGNVAPGPIRLPGFTATGRVERMEPYFAAADAAINPMLSGAGTNVKMCEYLALRLPVLSTRFGARGLHVADGETGFLFDKGGLVGALSRVRRLFDQDPGRLRGIADEAYVRNRTSIDMDVCVEALVEAIGRARESPGVAPLPRAATGAPPRVQGVGCQP
jgi:glycosyltransferase involved in cell wall biosynthesis